MTSAGVTARQNGHLRVRSRRDRIGGRLAVVGACLGVLAGVLEVTLGPSIRASVGDKLDTTRLGWMTIVLSSVALVTAATWTRRPGHRVAVAAGLLVPGLICFTTVGVLWYPPGVLLVFAGGLILAGTRRDELAQAVDERHWRIGLLALCGALYVFLGATAAGAAGITGIVGGVLIWATARVAPRSRPAAYGLLLIGALPFAVLTWWSVVTPFLAVVTLVIGRTVVRQASSGARPRAGHWGSYLHAAMYRLTSGRLLGRIGGRPVLLLQTAGRRTGRRRMTPVQYLPDGHAFVVVASDRGAARPPAWCLNLRADPHARVQVGERTLEVRAREVAGEERETLWERLTAADRHLVAAARKAGRELPLLVLEPVGRTTAPR